MTMTRRFFAGCLICAVPGFAASDVGAQSPAPTSGVKRTVLQKTDYPGDTHATYLVVGEVDPGVFVARHTHPGVETAMILEGSGILLVKGEADRPIKMGDSFQIPNGVPHALRNGDARMRIASNYVVEKDKPLASPAPE